MAGMAIGLIEAVGLATAVEAADAMVKSANVKLLGYELTKGGGLVTVKIEGEVGAVKAALDAGSAAGSKVNKIYSCHIIPRISEDTYNKMILPNNTIEEEKSEVPEDKEKEPAPVQEAEKSEDEKETAEAEEEVKTEEETENISDEEQLPEAGSEESSEAQPESEEEEPEALNKKIATCNLCNDPLCNRKKGDPKTMCIHYKIG